ncbi:MAG: VCBS repeat-containing protein [Paludibacteraceae bacterium]|nr:VCBS repeat-containing protein [Paludibacteraceae bacterium]
MKRFFIMIVALCSLGMGATKAAETSVSAQQWASAQSLTDGSEVGSIVQDGITISFSKGSGTQPTYNLSQLAIAAVSGNTLTLTAADGYELTQAEFSMYRAAQATNLAAASWSTGNATASDTKTTWKGKAESVTVTLNNTARFVQFVLATEQKAVPIVEDESKYNDTTVISIAQWIDDEGFSDGERVSNESYSKDGKTLTISYGYFQSGNVRLQKNGIMRFVAPYKMRKILLHFSHADYADYFLNGLNYYGTYNGPATCSNGVFQLYGADATKQTVAWLGSGGNVEMECFNDASIDGITIISDKTDNKVTVTFFGMDGKELKSEQVVIGGSVTAPVISHECFDGWNEDFSKVTSDLEVYPLYRIDKEYALATWWKNESSSLSSTDNGYTYSVAYSDRTEPQWYINYIDGVSTRCLVLKQGSVLSVKKPEVFRSFAIRTISEERAAYLAASTCNTGSLRQNGASVVWSGATTQLEITYPSDAWDNADIVSFGIPCEYYEQVPCTVIFLDKAGKELKRETVIAGGAATAPADPTGEECEQFAGWDQDYSKVRGDMTIRPLFETKKEFAITAYEWNAQQTIDRNDISQTQGDITVKIPSAYYSFDSDQTKCYIRMPRGKVLSVLNKNYIRNFSFTCTNEENAAILAASTFSNGSAKQEGVKVVWTGATDSLGITNADNYIVITAFESLCEVVSSHTVTFLDKDGKEISTQTIADGGSATAPADQPTPNECIVFKGWDSSFSNVHTDLTIRPVFESIEGCIPQGYVEVRFVDFFGDVLDEQLVKQGGTATAPATPVLKHHIFLGWDTPLTDIQFEPVVEKSITVTLSSDNVTTSSLYLYAWTDDNAEPLGIWPGTRMSKNENGDYSFSFDESVKSININWNWGGDSRTSTKDITGITASACYRCRYLANLQNIDAVDCAAAETGVTISPLYRYNKDSEGILTVAEASEAIAILREKNGSERDKYLKEAYAVKGIVHSVSALQTGGKLTIGITEDGQDGEEIYGFNMVGQELTPFVSQQQLQQGDTVVLFGKFIENRYNHSDRWGIGKGYIPYIGKLVSDDGFVFIDMPDGSTMYDMNGDGKKQALYVSSDNSLVLSGDKSSNFLFEKKLYGSVDGMNSLFPTDINHDGQPDFGITISDNKSKQAYSLLSEEDGYKAVEGALFLPQFDVNGDGRTDYIVVDISRWFVSEIGAGGGLGYGNWNSTTNYYLAYQQADGSFKPGYMQVMTWDRYETISSTAEWAATYKEKSYSSGRGLITPNYGYSSGMASLSGAALSRAPRRNAEASRAPSTGYTVPFITKALDLNADNLTDLIDENNGIVYLNMGDGIFVTAETNGMVVPADLNNDGLTDFIFPGEKLYVSIYKGEGNFETKTLYENAAVDELLYCYDFDHDGDIDILATFSAQRNATKTAYTCFFLNDGQGNFTQRPEQNYGSENLWFSALQDIDGDGYYDLLAFNGADGENSWTPTEHQVAWLRGNADLTFSAPQTLFTVEYANTPANLRINAEDLDNDGKAEIWVSGLAQGKTRIFTTEFGEAKTFGVTANTAPKAPAAPELRYENGLLTVTWRNGQDKETMTGDLTYALRLGTKAGGNDIVYAHANADGSRRNFLDGNMGKSHSYAVDLSTYAPATIYASVQTVDAQHAGSAWSLEASIVHNALPAQFSLSSEKIAFNESVEIHYTSLPDDYKHSWQQADGELIRQGSFLKLLFPTAGEKVITHTVTAPDGKAASYSATLTVLPAGISGEYLTCNSDNGYTISNIIGSSAKADFNGDGLLDVFNSYISQANGIVDYTQATGLWNTNIAISGRPVWFDWNKNGYADLQTYSYSRSEGYRFATLPHADNVQDMTSQKEDAGLAGFFSYNDGYTANPMRADMLHNGVPSVYAFAGSYDQEGGMFFQTLQSDGSYQYKDISINGDGKRAKQAFGYASESAGNWYSQTLNRVLDYNNDGWADVLYLNTEFVDNVIQYRTLYVYENKGNAVFDELAIPLQQALADEDLNLTDARFADLNNDGYVDLITHRSHAKPADYSIYILWNEENRSLSAPEILPLGELNDFYINEQILLADIDNNGYLDILSTQVNASLGKNGYSDIYGLYVWYMGQGGVMTQGFIQPQLERTYNFMYTDFPGAVYLYDSKGNYDAYGNLISSTPALREIAGSANTAPQAPTAVRAVQTENGLLVEWNSAADDHTPASQMRYNLSVKHAGRTGAGAFVISPQNGLNSKSAYLPGYEYIRATRFLVPLSELTAGDYEVQVQAIDQRNLMSDFSERIGVNIDRQIIDAPTTICWGDEALISYMSENRTGTPVWDFDGGTIESGSGFGPYRVSWNTAGTKTITLTLGDKRYERMIYVDQVEGWSNLPSALFDGGEVDVTWADGLSGDLQISINGALQSITRNGIDNRDPQLTFDGRTLVLDTKRAWSAENALTTFASLELVLTLSNGNGCSAVTQKPVQIISAQDKPEILLVTSDADGHNIISWNTTSDMLVAFPQVEVLKETNVRDQFVSLGTVSTSVGRYTDLSSDATQKAERYALRGVMESGTKTPASAVHQTVHTTINRGVSDNQWNLIWNQYVGADVVTYNILRGSGEGSLTQIASVSSYNTSYTDYAPQEGQPLYAIEYVLSAESQASASPRRHVIETVSQPSLQGRSNIVNRSAAKTMTYATSLTILSANGRYETTAENTLLLLYADFMPSNTTYKQVVWEITRGADMAAIDQSSGLVTALTPNKGGTISVKATAIDGSGVTATRIITIAAVEQKEEPIPVYYTIRFLNYDGTELQSKQVKEGAMPVYSGASPTKAEDDNYTYFFSGWSPAVVSASADADYTAQFTATAKQQPGSYTPTGLIASQDGSVVWLDWKAVDGVQYYEWEFIYNQNNRSLGGDITTELYGGLDFGESAPGSYSITCRVRSLDNNRQPISDWGSVEFTVVINNSVGIEETVRNDRWLNRKLLIDGILYIIRPDGTMYTATGVRVK